MTARQLWRFTLACVAIATLAIPAASAAPTTEYLVFLDNSVPRAELARAIENAGGQLLRDHSAIGLAIATSDSLNFPAVLSRHPAVRRVGQDIVLRSSADLLSGVRSAASPAIAGPGPAATRSMGVGNLAPLAGPLAAPPNNITVTDPTTAFFWDLFGWNYRAMHAEGAWALGYLGDPSVSVAMLDTGIDYLHLDMASKVDLSRSASFVPEDDALVAANFPGAHPVADLNFHGTLAAGVVACNALGTACTTPNVTLIGVKVVDMNYQSTVGRMVSGIMHAADVDADIINISWGFWPNFSMDTQAGRDAFTALKGAINYAKAQGSLVFAEASVNPIPPFTPGDDADHNGNIKILPAEAGAVVVSSTAANDDFSNFNNYGNSLVDISAPGGQLPFIAFNLTAVWGPCSSFTLIPAIDFCRLDAPVWVSVAGTIPATAEVSALAAMLKSAHPEWSNGRILNQIYKTADDLGTPGKDAFFGHGRINLTRAVTE
jgi:subtilisin family serine protease